MDWGGDREFRASDCRDPRFVTLLSGTADWALDWARVTALWLEDADEEGMIGEKVGGGEEVFV